MSTLEEPLDPATHQRILAERILPNSGLDQATPQATPRAIFTAGQPGGGKGGIVKAAERELKGNVVTIDPDELREFHPNVGPLRNTYPYTWSGYTHPDAKAWSEELRHAAVDSHRNVILDVTLAGPDPVIKQIHEMEAKGYQVEIRAVATHRLESELGVDQRFTDSLVRNGHGRYVDQSFQDFAYKALPASLDKVHAQTGARILIYNREGEQLYDSKTGHQKPGAALEQAREARMQDPTITQRTAQKWREQQDFHQHLPETVEHNPRINAETAKNLPPEHQKLAVAEGIDRNTVEAAAVDRAIRIEPGAAKVATGLKVLGTAAMVADAYSSGRDALHLYNQGNNTGAQSEVLHFTGRNLGMVGGAMAAGAAGAAAGIETGPGALVTGLVGGIAGGIAGDKIMDKVDQLRIYNQSGSDGNHWHLDPQGKEGWARTVTTNEIDPSGMPNLETGEPAYKTQTLHASGPLADELNYKASNAAVELALAHPHRPQDPFTQPVGKEEAAGDNWVRNPQTHVWSRNVDDPNPVFAVDGSITSTHVETASPQRSAQLEQAAQATIANNIAQSPHGVASHYQEAYDLYGWNQHGPVPQAVINAAHTPPSRQFASDGHEYTQGRNGEWTTPGILYGVNTAQPIVREELNATRQHEQAQQPAHQDTAQQGHAAAHQETAQQAPALSVHASKKEATDHMLAALLSDDHAVMHAGLDAGFNTHAVQQSLQHANHVATQAAQPDPARQAQHQPVPQPAQGAAMKQ